jgi:hypothetical protein
MLRRLRLREHAVFGKGCGVYADRPASCRAFYCSWMQDESFGPDWKAEKSKFVVYMQANAPNLQIAVDPRSDPTLAPKVTLGCLALGHSP